MSPDEWAVGKLAIGDKTQLGSKSFRDSEIYVGEFCPDEIDQFHQLDVNLKSFLKEDGDSVPRTIIGNISHAQQQHPKKKSVFVLAFPHLLLGLHRGITKGY